MPLLTDLMESPSNLPPSSRFTVANGVLYMAAGAFFLAWPGAVQALLFEAAYVGREEGLVRVIGMTLAIIGWFYFFGGRCGARQIVAASVLDRITLVPLVLIPLAIAGVFPHMMLLFAVLDPALGLVAWYLLSKEAD